MDYSSFGSLNLRSPVWAGALAATLLACGSSAPTHELKDARAAYDNAEDGPAKTRRPGELREAKRALDRAEKAHDDNPGSEREKRLATVAEHKAQVADARGEAAEAELAAQAARARADRESQALGAKSERASMAKTEREPVKPEPMAVQPRPIGSDQRTARERANNPEPERSRVAPENRAEAALQNLTQVAKVHQEDRGVVITLAGSLLFPTGKTELSPIAEQHLDQVAAALREQPDDREFLIEGYTDASGSERQNQQLSMKRAQAVADYLTAHGIVQSRTKVSGYGEQHPIADNDTEEGRASNRRVEVVIAKKGEELRN